MPEIIKFIAAAVLMEYPWADYTNLCVAGANSIKPLPMGGWREKRLTIHKAMMQEVYLQFHKYESAVTH